MATAGRIQKTTLRDIAEAAGVSIATVSKALNGRQDVHPTTRDEVLAVARRMNFRPDIYGEHGAIQRSPRSGTVGLLTDDLVGRFGIPILTGVENALGFEKTSVFLCDARGDGVRETFHIDALLRKKIDGLIIVGADSNVRPSLGRNFPVPVVYAYSASTDQEDCSVVPDNEGSTALATEHLLSLGRTNIAHITGLATSLAANARARSFARVLQDHGRAIAGEEVFFGDWSEAWGRASVTRLIGRGVEFDAIFCGNDQIARGAVDALRDAGRVVPDDVAVVGFDNWEVIATGSRPQITTVDMQLETLGDIAARRLFEAIEGQPRSGVERVPGQLVLRGSTIGQ